VREPQHCYLAYAADELEEGDVVLELLDQGLELSRPEVLRTQPRDSDADDWEPALAAAQDAVVPRVLVSPERAEELEQRLSTWGAVERLPLTRMDVADTLGEDGASLAGMSPEGGRETEMVLAAESLEWVIPKGLAGLPGVIRQKAQEKYAPYRDWRVYPPVYHYHVSQDRGYRVLQYWFLYAYNDWAAHGGYNDHEGDWEVIYVFLDARDQPQHVAYSRHVRIPGLYEPLTAPWAEVEALQGTHPVVYVGCGSHASYLHQDRYRILWRLDHAMGDDVSIGPAAGQSWGAPVRLDDKRWNLHFSGKWGSLVKRWLGMVLPGTAGPIGPAQKGDKWYQAAKWAGLTADH
jgi:hypothetical protein